MCKPIIAECHTVEQFMQEIHRLCDEYSVTGLAVVISIDNGNFLGSYQIGMDDKELIVASYLLSDFAKDEITDHIEH